MTPRPKTMAGRATAATQRTRETPASQATFRSDAVRLFAGFAGLGAAAVNLAVASSLFAAAGPVLPARAAGGAAALLYAGVKDIQLARTVNTAVGAVYLLVGILGLFLLSSPLNIIALNGADNVLHLASAVLLLGVGLSLDKVPATARA